MSTQSQNAIARAGSSTGRTGIYIASLIGGLLLLAALALVLFRPKHVTPTLLPDVVSPQRASASGISGAVVGAVVRDAVVTAAQQARSVSPDAAEQTDPTPAEPGAENYVKKVLAEPRDDAWADPMARTFEQDLFLDCSRRRAQAASYSQATPASSSL